MKEKRSFQIDANVISKAVESLVGDKIPQRILTGFPDLDDILGDIRKGELIVLGGRPAMGKTAFALSLMINTSIWDNKPVLCISKDVPKQRLTERLIQMFAGVIYNFENEEDYADKINSAVEEVHQARIHIEDSTSISVDEIEDVIRECEESPSIIIVDNIPFSDVEENDEDKMISSVQKLKELAKKYGCVVMALTQLSRNVESRKDRRPVLSDLRDHNNIEEIADKIIFLYRDEYYDRNSKWKGIAEAIVVKNTNGQTGVAKLAFLPEYVRFCSLERKSADSK